MAKSNTARKSEEVVVATTKETKVEKVNTVLRDENLEKLGKELKTKSAMIRYLAAKEHSRADIARAMNIRYQHVRNVLVQDAIKAEVAANTKTK